MTTKEIAERLNLTVSAVVNMKTRYGIEVPKNDKHRYEWTKEDYLFIKSKAEEIGKKTSVCQKITPRDKPTLEELKRRHPLVTDDRMFQLSYWPDTVPECFKELDA